MTRLRTDENGSIDLVDLWNDRSLREALARVAKDACSKHIDFDDDPKTCPRCDDALDGGPCDLGCDPEDTRLTAFSELKRTGTGGWL